MSATMQELQNRGINKYTSYVKAPAVFFDEILVFVNANNKQYYVKIIIITELMSKK